MMQQQSETDDDGNGGKSAFRIALERHYQSAIISIVGVLAMLMYADMKEYRSYGTQIVEVRAELKALKDQLSLVDSNLLLLATRVEDYNVFQHRIRSIEGKATDLDARIRELEKVLDRQRRPPQ